MVSTPAPTSATPTHQPLVKTLATGIESHFMLERSTLATQVDMLTYSLSLDGYRGITVLCSTQEQLELLDKPLGVNLLVVTELEKVRHSIDCLIVPVILLNLVGEEYLIKHWFSQLEPDSNVAWVGAREIETQ